MDGKHINKKQPLLQGILADVSIFTGYATIGLMLTGRLVFQYLGWQVAAMATPIVMFLSGGAFFGLSLAAVSGGSSLTAGSLNMASAGALAGAVTQVLPSTRWSPVPIDNNHPHPRLPSADVYQDEQMTARPEGKLCGCLEDGVL